MFKSMYNIYRPQCLNDLIGQEYIIQVLSNMLKKKQLFPVITLSGPRGTGKTSIARIVAKHINCQKYLENPMADHLPCNDCQNCRSIESEMALDIIEIDAATYTGVDNIKNVLESSYHEPSLLEKKVIIIDEIHMLSKGAFNSMLKTLEEPPSHVVFFLITTEESKIPETILSRTMILRTSLLKAKDITDKLGKITSIVPKEVLEFIGSNNDSMRDAIVQLEFIQHLDNQDLSSVMRALKACTNKDTADIYHEILLGNLNHAVGLWDSLKEYTDQNNFLKKLLYLIGNICKMTIGTMDFSEEYQRFQGLSMNLLIRHWEIVIYQLINSVKYGGSFVDITLVMLSTVVEEDVDYQVLHSTDRWVEGK